jgi:nucleotide-binding universal stress UspA family protein
MYKNILISTDGSELSSKAIDHGLALAKSVGAKVTAITVLVPIHIYPVEAGIVSNIPEQYHANIVAAAARDLDDIKAKAKAAGVECEAEAVEEEQAYEGIIGTAEKKGCDLIVMASHGRRGVSALVLGSETVKVLTHTTIPVLVIK